MQEVEWPKFFRASHRVAAMVENLAVYAALTPVIGELLRLVVFRMGMDLYVVAVGVIGALLIVAWWRTYRDVPVIEAWPDHIKLGRWGWPKMQPIYYNQIVFLQRTAGIGLEITYVRGGRKRKVPIGERYVVGLEELEAILKKKTGLDPHGRTTWKSRIVPAIMWTIDEPGAWKEHVLTFPLWSMAVGISLARLWSWLRSRYGIELPFWMLGILIPVAIVGYFYLFYRLRTQRQGPLG